MTDRRPPGWQCVCMTSAGVQEGKAGFVRGWGIGRCLVALGSLTALLLFGPPVVMPQTSRSVRLGRIARLSAGWITGTFMVILDSLRCLRSLALPRLAHTPRFDKVRRAWNSWIYFVTTKPVLELGFLGAPEGSHRLFPRACPRPEGVFFCLFFVVVVLVVGLALTAWGCRQLLLVLEE